MVGKEIEFGRTMAAITSDLVSRLLKQSIITLCREAVTYRNVLEIDGLVCLTVDKVAQHVVKIHDVYNNDTENSHENATVDRNLCASIKQPSKYLHAPEDDIRPAKLNNTAMCSSNQSIETVTVSKSLPTTDTKPLPINLVANEADAEMGIAQNNKAEMTTSESNNRLNNSYEGLDFARLSISKATNIACKKCNFILENVDKFENHNISLHGYFTCLICLATFTSRNNMKRHIRLHTGVKPYSCHQCSESFSRNDDYKRHILRHGFHKFRCVVCNAEFSERNIIKTHMLKQHGCTTFMICQQCGECFDDAHAFQLHKKTHSELQHHQCSLCYFTSANTLMHNKHMLTHRKPPKKYFCTHCEISFTDPFTYTIHLEKYKEDQLMTSYECCFCDTKLPNFDDFKSHEQLHVLPKQYACSVCSKQFPYPSYLRDHMLAHLQTSGAISSLLSDENDNINADTHTKTSNISDIVSVNDATNSVMNVEEHNSTDMDNMHDDHINDSVDKESPSSSEYWCTECHQGFGTELELQNHIANLHEILNETATNKLSVLTTDSMKTLSYLEHFGTCMKKRKLSESKLINDLIESPYNMLTRLDIKQYSELDAQCYSPRTKHRKNSGYADSVQMRILDISQRVQIRNDALCSDTTMPLYEKSERACGENTVLNEMNEDSNNLPMSGGKDAACNNSKKIALQPKTNETDFLKACSSMKRKLEKAAVTEKEINIVEDSFRHAVRPAREIRSQFGLASSLFDTDVDQTVDLLHRNTRTGHAKYSSLSSENQSEINDAILHSNGSVKLAPFLKQADVKTICGTLPDNATKLEEPTRDVSNMSQDIIVASADQMRNGSSIVLRANSNGFDNRYNKTAALRMTTDIPAAANIPTTLNLKIRNPGFEKVVTPETLFKTKAPFTCTLCSETFGDFKSFDQHGTGIHHRFICSYCGKVFTSRPNRERHVRYHTGEKPYRCEICDEAFYRGDDLKYHRTTKHADYKPFACNACNTFFGQAKDLEKHLKLNPSHKL